jgi:nitrogen regulatory protein PII
MTIRQADSGANLCQVIATMNASALTRLHDAIEGVPLFSVTVGSVVSWSDPGHELWYRGQRCMDNLKVSRVEIICADDQVDRIVHEIERCRNATGAHAPGKVVAVTLGARRAVPALTVRAHAAP